MVATVRGYSTVAQDASHPATKPASRSYVNSKIRYLVYLRVLVRVCTVLVLSSSTSVRDTLKSTTARVMEFEHVVRVQHDVPTCTECTVSPVKRARQAVDTTSRSDTRHTSSDMADCPSTHDNTSDQAIVRKKYIVRTVTIRSVGRV